MPKCMQAGDGNYYTNHGLVHSSTAADFQEGGWGWVVVVGGGEGSKTDKFLD